MKKRWSLFLLLCLLLTKCSAAAFGGGLIPAAEGSGTYSEALLPFLSGYSPQQAKDTLYAEISRGNVVACFDVQAIPAIERGVGRYWYPHVSATVVLAVDRTRTDAVITGWNSLRESRVPAGIGSFSVVRNMMAMGALSYGLNPENPSRWQTLDYLENLHQNGGFELDKPDAPVLICLDYEVVEWNRNGGHYEVVVPEEGTLSYRMGLLSDAPLTLESGLDDALLSVGLPLAGGEKPHGFPEEYRSARMLQEEDYDWFLDVAGDSSRDLRRQVFHTRLYTTADLREHILSAILISVAILLWKGTVSHRVIRHDVRGVVAALSWLMVGWLLLRLFKYQLPQEGTLCRLCWYGYYLFQLALPVALLYLTVILDRSEGEKHLLRPLWLPFAIYIVSVLLVMTNDLHQLVFRFTPGGNWSSDYRYGPGFWLVIVCSLLFLISALWNLLRKGYRSLNRKGRILPLLFCGGLLAYIAAYIKRVPLAWESDPTVCICLLSLLFFETVLHTGLIPVNIQYQRLFAAAPIRLALLDENGCTVQASRGTRAVSPFVWKRLRMDTKQSLLQDKDTLLHAIPVRNGMAVWQEDLSQINRLRQEIQNVQARLEAANALLREEGEIKKRLLSAETNRTLFEQLDRDMENRIASLVRLVETLPEAEHPKKRIAFITLCLCHIKRRCNLFFQARQGETLLCDELSIYLDELVELSRYAGMQTLIHCGQNVALEIRSATLCYDFAFEIISWALKEDASPLMGYLELQHAHLSFRFLPNVDPGQWRYSEELMTALSALGGQIACKDLDDAVGICMTVPLRGEVRG